MHWDSDEVAALARPWMTETARELASPVETVRRQAVRDGPPADLLERYRDRGFDHVPVRPYHHDQYVDVESGTVEPVALGQYVDHDETALHVLNALTEYPFALVRHPDNDRFRIATAADLNGRAATTHLSRPFAEAADAVADLLAARYDAADLLPTYLRATEAAAPGARPERAGDPAREWARARSAGVDPHLADLLDLADLGAVVAELAEVRADLDLGDARATRRTFEHAGDYHARLVRPDRLVVLEHADVAGLAAAIEDADRIATRAAALAE